MKIRPNHCNRETNRQLPPQRPARPIRRDGGTRSTILRPGLHASSPVSYWSSRASPWSSARGSSPSAITVTFLEPWQILPSLSCRKKTPAFSVLVRQRAGSGSTAVSTECPVEIFSTPAILLGAAAICARAGVRQSRTGRVSPELVSAWCSQHSDAGGVNTARVIRRAIAGLVIGTAQTRHRSSSGLPNIGSHDVPTCGDGCNHVVRQSDYHGRVDEFSAQN